MLVFKELTDRLFLHVVINVTNKDSYRKYFLPNPKIKNYNIEIDGRNFYDQSINDLIKQYDEVRKISTGQSDYYTTSCLLDFAYSQKNYKLIVADLSKQKVLDANPKAIQLIIFTGKKIIQLGFITSLNNQKKQY